MSVERRKPDTGFHTELAGKKKMDYGVGVRRNGDPSYPDHAPSKGVSGRVAPGTDRGGDPTYPDYADPAHKWIKGAIKHPGALHKQLGVPQGEKIPAKKMSAARAGKYGPKAEKRAHLAKTLSKF